MIGANGNSNLGQVEIVTLDYRGHTPEELADRALRHIIQIGTNSHPAIIAQAVAFKEEIRKVLVHYMTIAQASERSNIVGALDKHGQADTAKLVRSTF